MTVNASLAASFVTDGRIFRVLESTGAAADANGRDATTIAVPIAVASASRMRQCTRLVLLRVTVHAAARRLARAGAIPTGTYGVFPDAATPQIVYELRTPAADYAERYLLPTSPPRVLTSWVRRALRIVAGCDPAIGHVIVIGQRRDR